MEAANAEAAEERVAAVAQALVAQAAALAQAEASEGALAAAERHRGPRLRKRVASRSPYKSLSGATSGTAHASQSSLRPKRLSKLYPATRGQRQIPPLQIAGGHCSDVPLVSEYRFDYTDPGRMEAVSCRTLEALVKEYEENVAAGELCECLVAFTEENGIVWYPAQVIQTANRVMNFDFDDGTQENCALSFSNGQLVMLLLDSGHFLLPLPPLLLPAPPPC